MNFIMGLTMACILTILAVCLIDTYFPAQSQSCREASSEEIDKAWRAGYAWGFTAGYQSAKKGEHAP